MQINNRDVIEQAAIAGILNLEMLGNAEAAAYLAKRLDQISDPLERGWKAEPRTGADGAHIEITRTLRGITETHYLNRKFIQTSEARQLIARLACYRKFLLKGLFLRRLMRNSVLKDHPKWRHRSLPLARKGRRLPAIKV